MTEISQNVLTAIPDSGQDGNLAKMEKDSTQIIEDSQATRRSFGEVGGVRGNLSLGKRAANLKSDDIVGCGFQWNIDMVVLAACDTLRGEITADSVLNLPRAFLIAGVPCIVASQWQVPDVSTSVLMQGFYTHLRRGKDAASALRASMLQMLQTLNPDDQQEVYHVHQWAPFLVWGLPTICLPPHLQDP